MAQALIHKFGSLPGVLRARPDARDLGPDEREALLALRAASQLITYALEHQLESKRIKITCAALHQYLMSHFAAREDEAIVAIFLDHADMLLRQHVLANGNVGEVSIPMRELSRNALELGAQKVILAHNHPSQVASATREDIAATENLARVLHALGIELVDHLVVTRKAVFSMRMNKCL